MRSAVRILVADDHSVFRQGLSQLLLTQADLEVVDEAADGDEMLAAAIRTKPDLVLTDISMPGMVVFDAVRRIKQELPETRIVFLSVHDDRQNLMETVAAGGNGYLLKDEPAERILAGIREVMAGENSLSPRMLAHLMDGMRMAPRAPVRTPGDELSAREREVLRILAQGKSIKEIALTFNLSTKTIGAHKFSLMKKLGIQNNAQLVQYAVATRVVKV